MQMMIITEREISRTCLCCKQEYKDTQILVNGVPSARFNICPDCIQSGEFAKYLERKLSDDANE